MWLKKIKIKGTCQDTTNFKCLLGVITNNVDCLECTISVCLKCASTNSNKYLKNDGSDCISNCVSDPSTYTNNTISTDLKCKWCNITISDCG